MNSRRRTQIASHVAWVAALTLFTLGTTARAEQITGIVAFGDSLSDTGNTFLAAGSPPAPYYQGHYSNGPIWLEYLAARLGVAAPTPSLAGGLDNAWGGAETGDGTSFMGTPNIGTQIAAFLGAGNTLSPTQLVTVWGGANDFLNAGVTDPTIPVANLAAEITALAAAGGKQFLVPNLPLLGELPATNTLPLAQRQGLDGLSLAFDGLLAARLTQLQSDLGVTIHQFDDQTIFANILASPGSYGFTNVTTSALGDGVLSADGYFFWDSVHPTTAAQQLIGNAAAAMVPEPSSFALLLAAGCTLMAWRQARGRRQRG